MKCEIINPKFYLPSQARQAMIDGVFSWRAFSWAVTKFKENSTEDKKP